MRTRSAVVAVALAFGLLGCGDDADSGGGFSGAGGDGGAGGASQHGTGGSATGAAAHDAAGSHAGSGASAAGTGGAHAGGASGRDGGSDDGGDASAGEQDAGPGVCNLACVVGKHCELMPVTCIRAPCPPQPMCVDDAAASGQTCGTRGAKPCADDEYCDFPAGSECGATDKGGACKTKPGACTKELHQVCGCDGETYGNPCTAAAAGVSVEHEGACG